MEIWKKMWVGVFLLNTVYVRFGFVEMQAENLDRVEVWGKKLRRQEWTDWQPFYSRRRDEEGKGKRKYRSGFNPCFVNCNNISASDLLQFPQRI